jgi:hypothetical protein
MTANQFATNEFDHLIDQHIDNVELPMEYRLRVVKANNTSFDITMDYKPYRINVETEDDIITKVKGLY